jgi:hypothetical protein
MQKLCAESEFRFGIYNSRLIARLTVCQSGGSEPARPYVGATTSHDGSTWSRLNLAVLMLGGTSPLGGNALCAMS